MTLLDHNRAVMQQALEALESALACPVWPSTLKKSAGVPEAITALRAALATPQAEPVAIPQVPNKYGHLLTSEALWGMYVEDGTAPQPRQDWVLVPKQWTREMRHAFIHAAAQTVTGKETAGWEAALAARPKKTT